MASASVPVATTIPATAIPEYLPQGDTGGVTPTMFTFEQSRSDAQTDAEKAYLEANPDVAAAGVNPFYHYVTYGAEEGRSWGEAPASTSTHAASTSTATTSVKSAEDILKEMGYPTYEESIAEQEKAQGLSSRDELYAQYLNYADTALEYVNTLISQEAANAAVLGIDYNVTQAEKDTRVSNYFASIWGAGDQSRLEGLITDWGAPEGFTGFTVTRGDASAVSRNTPGSTTVLSKSARMPLTDEEEAPAGTLLGA